MLALPYMKWHPTEQCKSRCCIVTSRLNVLHCLRKELQVRFYLSIYLVWYLYRLSPFCLICIQQPHVVIFKVKKIKLKKNKNLRHTIHFTCHMWLTVSILDKTKQNKNFHFCKKFYFYVIKIFWKILKKISIKWDNICKGLSLVLIVK